MISYKLRDWFPYEKIDWNAILENPLAIDIIKDKLKEENPKSEINWKLLSSNTNAMDILKHDQDKIEYYRIILNKWVDLFKYDGGVDINFKSFDYKLFDKVIENYLNVHIITFRVLGFSQYSHFLENIKYPSVEDKILLFAGYDIEYFKLIHYKKYYIENYKDIVIKNYKKIDWFNISINLDDKDLLQKYKKYLNWENLSLNPNAIELLKENENYINLDNLTLNPNCYDIIIKNIDILDDLHWQNLSACVNSIQLLKDNKDKINYYYLVLNIYAIDLIEEFILEDIKNNTEKINFCRLAYNKNAGVLIEKYLYKINIITSYDVPHHNIYEVHIDILCKNPLIFTYDYDKMKNNKKNINEDIIKYWYHPHKIKKYLENNDEIDNYLN